MKLAWFGLVAAFLATGCETGTEVTGVASASALRQSDGTVLVNAATACLLKAGLPRADGNCDSDDDTACFHADWVERANHGVVVASAKTCLSIGHVRRDAVKLTSPGPIAATDAYDILVYTEEQPNAAATVVIASP